MQYLYYCLERPPMPGAIPNAGLVETGNDLCFPQDTFCCGWCIYNRKLSVAEMAIFRLCGGEEVTNDNDASD